MSTLGRRAEIFSALSDPIRLRILDLLTNQPRCVCELQNSIDIQANLLSYHLKILRDAGLVESERRGRWVDYRLTPDAQADLATAIPPSLRTEPET